MYLSPDKFLDKNNNILNLEKCGKRSVISNNFRVEKQSVCIKKDTCILQCSKRI